MDTGTQFEAELRQTLERERERLRASLGWLATAEVELADSQGQESDAGGEQADVASDSAENSLDLALERSERERLSEVEAALERLDHHRYGVCERCGQAIDPDRLAALPWTRFCVRCATARPRQASYRRLA